MSTSDTLSRIAKVFGELGQGAPDEALKRVLFQQLAEDFARLSLDLAMRTGWQSPVGTDSYGAFNTATVSLPDLAQNVKGLIDAGIQRGEIGP
jgi:hypothetical protein